MFEVTDMLFQNGKKYIVYLTLSYGDVLEQVYEPHYYVVSLIALELDISYQKLNAVTRKHNGCFRKCYVFITNRKTCIA